jgi:predicted metal-binding membrane protein
VMSLVCIALLAVLVLAEKILPLPAQSGRLTGAALLLAGAWMAVSGIV